MERVLQEIRKCRLLSRRHPHHRKVCSRAFDQFGSSSKAIARFWSEIATKQVPVDADQSGIFGLLHTSTRTRTKQRTRTKVVLGTGKLLRSFLESSLKDL